MKYFLTLLMIASFCYQSNAQSKRVQFGITPEINYSIIENKNINDDSFNVRPSIGFGVTAPIRINLNDKSAIVTGIKIGFHTYNFDFGTINQVSQSIGASLPISFEHQISKKWLLGIGSDLSWRREYLNTFNVYVASEELLSSVVFQGHNIVTTPIRLYAGYSFYSKKGRKSDLILTIQKGIQNHETVTMLNFAGQAETVSAFNYKATHFAIGYRFNFGKNVE